MVFARQHPWFGYWDVSVECFDCGSGYRAPTRCWRRARLDVVVSALLRHLDFEDAQ